MRKSFILIGSLLFSATAIVSFQDNPLQQSITRGAEIYAAHCASCHMQKGEGMEGAFPPLAKADYIKKDKTGKKSIGVVLHGLQGEISVNGKKYNVPMPAQAYLSDQQIADVLNYVRNSWGNKGKIITEDMVKNERNAQQ
jgi:mono/diheme cytochrome c family protein